MRPQGKLGWRQKRIHRSGAETFEIEGDKFKAESFEDAGEFRRHRWIERTGQFLRCNFDANQIAVVADAALAKAKAAERIFSLFHHT